MDIQNVHQTVKNFMPSCNTSFLKNNSEEESSGQLSLDLSTDKVETITNVDGVLMTQQDEPLDLSLKSSRSDQSKCFDLSLALNLSAECRVTSPDRLAIHADQLNTACTSIHLMNGTQSIPSTPNKSGTPLERSIVVKASIPLEDCTKQFAYTPLAGSNPLMAFVRNGSYTVQVNTSTLPLSETADLQPLASHSLKQKPSYACDQCDKVFKRKSLLAVHKRKHSGHRPFACDQCDKAFFRKNNLNEHLRTHSKERPFTCVNCNKSFAHSGSYSQHLRNHCHENSLSCDQCSKVFKRNSSLAVHKCKHSSHRPFACDQCDKAFFRRNNLNEHLRTHSKERPFTCVNCNKSFTHSGSYSQHLRNHCHGNSKS